MSLSITLQKSSKRKNSKDKMVKVEDNGSTLDTKGNYIFLLGCEN